MGEFPESLTQNFRDFRVVGRTIMMSKKSICRRAMQRTVSGELRDSTHRRRKAVHRHKKDGAPACKRRHTCIKKRRCAYIGKDGYCIRTLFIIKLSVLI